MQRIVLGAILLPTLGAAALLPALAIHPKDPMTRTANTQADPAGQATPTSVPLRVFNDRGELVGPIALPRVERTDAEWKAALSDEQYRILRHAGTEAPFCGTLLDNKKTGVYACAGCRLPLFSSDHKFNSGTGWPSFYQPVAKENVAERVDRSHGMVRTEVVCARCDGHLGHVFDDGPAPTGQRHCLNSESLVFVDSDRVADLAEVAEAVFAGGCFWCVEAVFEELRGVHEVVSGYAGGQGGDRPTYESVSTGATGHAEVVKIIYDPKVIGYEDLLRIHFATHDPTTLNRQGADVGTQYRSALFYRDDREKALAEAFIEELGSQGVYKSPVVTTVEPLTAFHEAEAYHQNYVCNNPGNPYVRSVALPKVDKVREAFSDRLKQAATPSAGD